MAHQKPIEDRASYLFGRDLNGDPRSRPCPDRKVNLFPSAIGEEDEAENSNGSTPSDASSSNSDDNSAAVVLRLRPTAQKNPDYSIVNNIFVHRAAASLDNNQAKVPEKQYTFSHIFPDNTSQSEVYQTCVHDAIQHDENLTVLTYGTSGSGKTFTLLGVHADNPGIIPRAIEHIFARYAQHVCETPAVKVVRGNVDIVQDQRHRAEAGLRNSLLGQVGKMSTGADEAYAMHHRRIVQEHSFAATADVENNVFIWVSFAEIYNENVYDLLATPAATTTAAASKASHGSSAKENMHPMMATVSRKGLKIISNDGNAYIKDLNAVHCRSAYDAYRLLVAGLGNVTYASTNINHNSSRSHCIFFVEVIKQKKPYEFEHITYKFCDLAGSERQKKTDNVGHRLKEAQSINNSLMVLGRCLDAVYNKLSIVPIRDSKLTVLLQSSLLGREKIKMIVNMMPSLEYNEENLNVLNFASMAKQIVYKPPALAKRKAIRNTARFSWFMENAASNSSPKRGASNGEQYMGDTSQISLLLDENDRLKMENEDLLDQVDELRREMDREIEQRVMEKARELITDYEKRAKRSDELWQKRTDYNNEMHEKMLQREIQRTEAKYLRIIDGLEKRIAELQGSRSGTDNSPAERLPDQFDLTNDDEEDSDTDDEGEEVCINQSPRESSDSSSEEEYEPIVKEFATEEVVPIIQVVETTQQETSADHNSIAGHVEADAGIFFGSDEPPEKRNRISP